MKKLSNAGSRQRRVILKTSLWGLASLFTLSLLLGTYGVPRIIKLHLRKAALIESNRNLTAELVDAVRDRDLLLTNPAYLEKIARTRFYLVRPGETIYRYRGR